MVGSTYAVLGYWTVETINSSSPYAVRGALQWACDEIDRLNREAATARSAGAIEALTALPCEDQQGQEGLPCIDTAFVKTLYCPRCRALAALKGGAE